MSYNLDPGPAPMPQVSWDIRREGRAWTADEAFGRWELTPEKFEMDGGKLFWDETQRLTLLALLLENVGVDQAVRLGITHEPLVLPDMLVRVQFDGSKSVFHDFMDAMQFAGREDEVFGRWMLQRERFRDQLAEHELSSGQPGEDDNRLG